MRIVRLDFFFIVEFRYFCSRAGAEFCLIGRRFCQVDSRDASFLLQNCNVRDRLQKRTSDNADQVMQVRTLPMTGKVESAHVLRLFTGRPGLRLDVHVAKRFSPGVTTCGFTLLAVVLIAATIRVATPDYADVRAGRVDAGYLESNNCRKCHEGNYATWHATFHRTMTQEANPQQCPWRF